MTEKRIDAGPGATPEQLRWAAVEMLRDSMTGLSGRLMSAETKRMVRALLETLQSDVDGPEVSQRVSSHYNPYNTEPARVPEPIRPRHVFGRVGAVAFAPGGRRILVEVTTGPGMTVPVTLEVCEGAKLTLDDGALRTIDQAAAWLVENPCDVRLSLSSDAERVTSAEFIRSVVPSPVTEPPT